MPKLHALAATNGCRRGWPNASTLHGVSLTSSMFRLSPGLSTLCTDSDARNLGLEQLSTKIADMRDLVTLSSSFSPLASTSGPPRISRGPAANVPAPSSPGIGSPHLSPALSPGAGPLSANSRSFSRVVSAPASSASFSSGLSLPRSGLGRTPSGLGSNVVTFERESVGSHSPASTLLDSPDLQSPVAVGKPMRRQISRSKTGAVAFGSPRQSSISSVEILAASNMLSRCARPGCIAVVPIS